MGNARYGGGSVVLRSKMLDRAQQAGPAVKGTNGGVTLAPSNLLYAQRQASVLCGAVFVCALLTRSRFCSYFKLMSFPPHFVTGATATAKGGRGADSGPE